MPEPISDSAAETTSGGTASGESKPDPIAEAVDAAYAQVRGEGAATDSTTDTTQDGTDTSAEGDSEAQVSDGEDGEGAEGESTDEAQPVFYTEDELKDFKPTQLYNLDLNRVPPELRGMVQGLKATFTRNFQEVARLKKEGGDQTTAEPNTSRGDTKQLSREELYDMAMEGPEGFDRALDIAMKAKLDKAFEERGFTNEEVEDRKGQKLVADAEQIVVETYPELVNDERFRKEIGAELKKDPALAARLNRAVNSDDPEKLAGVLEVAAERVKSNRYRQTEAARAKARTSKETATAKETASVASKTNVKGVGSQQRTGPVSLDESLDEAIKRAGAKSFR